ncbi:MAG: FtsX-like permease family protein [Chloroflexota bacterium]|nr:ABC transporter permease [Dehalococcoidia bacterium]MDW8252356.1 FtsX-like permease family protein [Chloroflexota bacterium]
MLTREKAAPPADLPIPVSFRLPLALRSIVRRWRKVVGATIGLSFALSVVVAFLELSAGGTYLFTSEYTETEMDIYVLMQGGVIAPILPGERLGEIEDGRLFLSQVRAFPEVRAVIGIYLTALSRERERLPNGQQATEPWTAVGVYGDPSRVAGTLVLKEGRWFRPGNEIVVGQSLADARRLRVGDTVILNGRRFQITGVGHLRGVGYGSNGYAYLDFDTARELSRGRDVVNLVMIDTANPAATAARITRARDVQVLTKDEAIASVLELANSRLVVYVLFSGLALGVAGLFIASVLGASVNERRTEFATMLAIGLPKRTILSLVLGEALVIAVIASFVGTVIGIGIGELMNVYFAPIAQIERIAVFEPVMAAQILAISIALGAIAGFFPARAALSLQPADALREA